jgi:DNA-binding transcriptional regulator YhcF (GntR family)
MTKTTPEVQVPKIVEIDCSTGVETTRDMTEEEIAAQEAMFASAEQERAIREAEAKALEEAKNTAIAKLEALGLTTAEIAAITK